MATCDNVPLASQIEEFVADMTYVETYVETSALTATTPQGRVRRTLAGIDAAAQDVIDSLGFTRLEGVTFETGATVPDNRSLLLWATADGGTGFYYYFSGEIPSGGKIVSPDSTPASTGGTGDGGWLVIDDLEQRLADGTADVGGETSGDLARKYVEYPSITDFDAVGNLTTDDTTAVSNAMLELGTFITAPAGDLYRVTVYENPRGKQIFGGGSIVKTIGTDVYQKLDTYADINQHICGIEYLFPFHNLLLGQSNTPTRSPKVVITGDSTSTNGFTTDPRFYLDAILKASARAKGLQTPYGIDVQLRGQPGKTAKDWITDYLGDDLATNPDLYIIHWGINHGTDNAGNSLPEGTTQLSPLRQDPENWLADMDFALGLIRASRTLAQMQIILMTPNSTSDSPNARDELWYEAIAPGLKELARKYQCCFIDKYAIMKDSRPAADLWMDNPFGDGRAIHPLNVMTAMVADLISRVAFPTSLIPAISTAQLRVEAGLAITINASQQPDVFSTGINIFRATTGFPFDGFVEVVKGMDGIVVQKNYPYLNSRTRYAVRTGRYTAIGSGIGWDAWSYVGTDAAAMTPQSGFTLPGVGDARAAIDGSHVDLGGYVSVSSPGVVAAGTIVAIAPAGYRPTQENQFIQCGTFASGVFGSVDAYINKAGEVILIESTPANTARIYFSGGYSVYEAT